MIQALIATPPKNSPTAPPAKTNPSAIVKEFAVHVAKSYPIDEVLNIFNPFPKIFAPLIQVVTFG